MEYVICETCSHVNGMYLESKEFTRKVYEEGDYGKVYKEQSVEDYQNRVHNIYTPKVDFLIESLLEQQADVKSYKYLDVGAGTGYFVAALREKGFAASGIEVSKKQVEEGNKMLKLDALTALSDEEVTECIQHAECDVISFIGVFEHMVNLEEVLAAIKSNTHIKWVYFSVPMFSYSTMFEAISPDIFDRNLGGTHTHIFTDASIDYMCKLNNWNIVSSWKFGTDMPDLARMIQVKMIKDQNEELAKLFQEKMYGIIDELQLIVDKSEFADEIHVLVRKK